MEQPEDCIHGFAPGECAICSTSSHAAVDGTHDRTGHEKWLIYCPELADDTLLHFNRQGDSYALRAFVGRLARPTTARWTQPDAATSDEFLRIYEPRLVDEVSGLGVALSRDERWVEIVTEANRRFGIPNVGRPDTLGTEVESEKF